MVTKRGESERSPQKTPPAATNADLLCGGGGSRVAWRLQIRLGPEGAWCVCVHRFDPAPYLLAALFTPFVFPFNRPPFVSPPPFLYFT